MYKLFEDNNGEIWELTDVIIHPHGGGFSHKIPIEELYKEMVAFYGNPDELRFTLVSLEEYLTRVPAYIERKKWNGWAIPYFTFENAVEITKAFHDMKYDTDRDAFFTTVDGQEEDVFFSQLKSVGGEEMLLYPIGAMCWCWDEEP